MKFLGLVRDEMLILKDMLKCAKSMNIGEYIILDYLDYGALPDGMERAKDERGLYLCKCIVPADMYSPGAAEGRVQPMYNLTTHKKAGATQPIYIRPQMKLTEKKIAGLGTFSGAPAYENVFGYDDASIRTLIEESERKEREKIVSKRI